MTRGNINSVTPDQFLLSDLLSGETATITGLELQGEEYERVARIGLIPGRKVTLLSSGSRILAHISGATCALDKKLAAAITVQKDSLRS